MKHAILAVAAVLALTACGSAPPATPQLGGAAPAVRIAQAEAPDPVAVTIPAIDAHSDLVRLGLTSTGELATPPVDQPMQAGWYAGADPALEATGDEHDPGEIGPAVIVGHVDGIGPDGHNGHPGVFHRLSRLAPGDEVLVERADGSQLAFVVERIERHPKDEFPTEAVYGPTDEPELRLITCGGEFDGQHYVDNWIAWARLA